MPVHTHPVQVSGNNHSHEQDEYGLEFNGNTQVLYDDELYYGGRYFTGLGHHFITFPRRQLYIVFSDYYSNESYEIDDEDELGENTRSTIQCRST